MSMTRNNPESSSDGFRGDPDAAPSDPPPADDARAADDESIETPVAEQGDRSDQPEMSGEEEPILQFRESRRQRPAVRSEPLD